MAFEQNGITSFNNTSNAPKYYSYTSEVDAIATIVASGYFDNIADSLSVNQLMIINATDGVAFRVINTLSPVTVKALG